MRFLFLIHCLLLCCLTTSSFAQQPTESNTSTPAAEIQQKVREWVRVRQMIAEESAQWQAEKEQLAALNDLRAKESAQLDEYIAAAGNRVQEADEERRQLIADEESLREQRAAMEQQVDKLETQLRQQIGTYPTPLRNSVSEAISRLEKPDPSAPLQNRWRDVVLILGEVARFHNKLTIDTEIRNIGDQRVEVDVIYLGLSQAWYVDRPGKNAGTGTPSDQGWQWSPDNSIANEVKEAIAIAAKKTNPDFITLPLSGAAR